MRSLLLLLLGILLPGQAVAAERPGTAGADRPQPAVAPEVQRWLTPQNWRRESDGPVLSLGEPGRFDDTHLFAPSVIKEGDKYRMWFVDPVVHPWRLRHAESRDGSSWKVSEKPCIVIDQPWEKKDLVYPTVLKIDGLYVMRYGCYWNDDVHTALGMAVSRDGLSWTKNPHNPVFRPEPSHPWESNFTTSQTLMRMPDGSWRLWYASRTAPPWTNLYFAIGAARWSGPGK